MKKIIIDLDNTITIDNSSQEYSDKKVNDEVRRKLFEYQKNGFVICVNTARNMNSFGGNIGIINKITLPIIIEWLEANEVPYDELIVGKPWCGSEGFYVDDRAIRPDEFVNLTFDEIKKILN